MIWNFYPFNKHVSLALGCILLVQSEILAQEKFTDNLSLTANYHQGVIIPEYTNIGYLVQEKVGSVSLNISKKTSGKTDWEQVYKYPEYGISVLYSTLGNEKVHGREIGLFPYFGLNIISRKKFTLYNQTGFGMGYITRKFDLKNNYLNIAVGSHLNFHVNFKFGASYEIAKKIRLHTGVSFDHFSNGNLSNPNLGLNFVTLYSGVGYLVGSATDRTKREMERYKRSHHYELIFSPGMKHPRVNSPKYYFTSSLTFEYKWKPFRAVHFGVGGDLFFDSSSKIEMGTANGTDFKKSDNFRSGIHVSQEFVYSRLSIIFQEGVYVVLTDHVNQNVMYNRGIVRFRPMDNFFVQISMKSHLNILDYPELGLGFKW